MKQSDRHGSTQLGRELSSRRPNWPTLISLFISLPSAAFAGFVAFAQFGRVDVVDAGFVYWRVLPRQEARVTDWGYPVDLLPLIKEREDTGKYGLPSRLVAYDPKTNEPFTQITGATLREFYDRLRTFPGARPGLVPMKHFQVEFAVQNLGNTSVRGLMTAIDKKTASGWKAEEYSGPANLSPLQKLFRFVDFIVPLDHVLPPRLDFRIRLKYRNIFLWQTREEILLYFDSQNGIFHIGG